MTKDDLYIGNVLYDPVIRDHGIILHRSSRVFDTWFSMYLVRNNEINSYGVETSRWERDHYMRTICQLVDHYDELDIMKRLRTCLMKDTLGDFKWNKEFKDSFRVINRAIILKDLLK